MTIDDIAAALVTAGLGQATADTSDWFIFGNYMQAEPDRAICIYNTPGRPPETGTPADYPGIQVKVRGKEDDMEALLAKEDAIYQFLHGVNPTLLGASYTYCFATQSSPLPMGQDENRRPALTRNYKLMKVRG